MESVLNEVQLVPLTHPQKRISYVEQRYEASPIHVVGCLSRIEGEVDFKLLEHAIRLVLHQHEAFRLRFVQEDGELKQFVQSGLAEDVTAFMDFSVEDDPEQAMQQWLDREENTPIPLMDGCLFRITMFRISEQHCGFLTLFHHMIGDGWSLQLFIDGIGKRYEQLLLQGENVLDEEATGYLSWRHQEQTYLASSRAERDRLFWQESLQHLPEPMFPEDSSSCIAGARQSFRLGEEDTGALRKLAQKLGCTENTMLTGLVLLYLQRTLMRDDLVIGTPVFNRSGKLEKKIFGVFTSTMPLRVQMDATEQVSLFFERLNRIIRRSHSHQKYPYDLLVQQLELRRIGLEQVFQVSVNVFNTTLLTELDGMTVKHREVYSGNQGNALQFVINDWNGENDYTIDIQYKTSLFTDESIGKTIAVLRHLLRQLLNNSEQRISSLSVVLEDERRQQLYAFNETKLELPRYQSIVEWLKEGAAQRPDAIALAFKDQEMTYSELNKRADQIAWQLRESGAGPNRIVAIMANRSIEMIVAIYGVLLSGGAYLPIDPAYPRDRIAYLLEDSGAQTMLVQRGLRQQKAMAELGIKCLEVSIDEPLDESIDGGDRYNDQLSFVNTPDHLAYMIYTSGSTGKPKGVMIQHHSLINFIAAMKEQLPFEEGAIMLCVTTISFDIFVLETLAPLAFGMKIVIADEAEQVDGALLNKLIVNERIQWLQTTPSRMLLLLADEGAAEALGLLNYILLGGEPFPAVLREQLTQITNARLFNMFGPTETTVWSTMQELTSEEAITIGRPIANTSVYILGEHQELLPIGMAGELCISGYGLARGYWNRPELTDEKFVPHPFESGQKLYRTGDLAKWLPNGQLQHLGRMDQQVKIRGYRIELGEIESCLMMLEAVHMAAVVVWISPSGIQELIAYVKVNRPLESSELRSQLAVHLPGYMLPSRYIQLEQLPLTPNGKVDRKALPDQQTTGVSQAQAALMADSQTSKTQVVKLETAMSVEAAKRLTTSHATVSLPEADETDEGAAAVEYSLERTIVNCWLSILAGHNISHSDNFFEVGGHSLHVLKVISVMKDRGIPVQASDMYAEPTASGLAERLRKRHGAFVFEPWQDTSVNKEVVSAITINGAITTNRDAYRWEQVNCFTKPMAILFESFQRGYFELFLFRYNFYMTFFADKWKESPFEREEEPNADFVDLYEKKLKEAFQLDISKVTFNDANELRALLQEGLRNGQRMLVPGDLYGLYYSNHYLGEPHTHYFVIKGYDAKRDLVYMLDNMHIEGGALPVYKDFVIQTEQLVGMSRFYAQHWCPEGSIPYLLSLEERADVQEAMDKRSLLCEHLELLERWTQDSSLIIYLEEEMLKEIEVRRDTSRITKLIPLTNYKSVYYDQLFSFMESLQVEQSGIDELRLLSMAIGEEWEQFRLALFDRVADRRYEVKDLKIEATRIAQMETMFFHTLRQLLAGANLRERSLNEEASAGIGHFAEFNLNAQNGVWQADSLTMIHTTARIDDTWIVKDEAPQLLATPTKEQFRMEATVVNRNKYGPCYHSGLIVKFKDHSKIMFGNARRKLLGVFYPERTDNYELFARLDVQEKHRLCIEASGDELYFRVKHESEADWELVCSFKISEPVISVGLFSKTWEPTDHQTEFTEIIFYDGEGESGNEHETA
ncbi:non-ribosomal peptide synthetase [Bacillus sp. FJAT-26390]|uniref:non-ribosomal peptide synthetase n=1 Tax=Bacillus sp. FJAT-26390 TaxID=1743142 RepID=UPI000807CCAD|nr:non-ribosomal peptide synthetase [Bacillus sp. FJAT-26390]OBZ13243.1 hypothetical protein A7975_10275 [Bacillus sp. FJAT-26390]